LILSQGQQLAFIIVIENVPIKPTCAKIYNNDINKNT